MLAAYLGAHRGETIAVLGSGPSLASFAGREPIAIAVNGAAACDVPYRYFTCGDIEAPQREWFYGSRRHRARRIVASFLAPSDEVLFPSALTRARLRLARLPRMVQARLQSSLDPLYDYRPSVSPASGHGWFRYYEREFPTSEEELRACLGAERLAHGASIAGVAVQLALLMGAGAIQLYGCSMDNDAGDNYHLPGSSGRTTPLQRENFQRLLSWVRGAGVSVVER